MKTVNRELAAHAHHRRIAVVLHGDRIGTQVDKVVRRAWDRLMKLIRPQFSGEHVYHLMTELGDALVKVVGTGLVEAVHYTHRNAADSLLEAVPLPLLRRALVRQPGFTLPVTEDDKPETLSRDEQKELIKQALFPAPSREEVRKIVFSNGWKDRIESGTKLGKPRLIATAITNGFAEGKTPKQIARDLLPLVNGVASSARRIARTETMRVAQYQDMKSNEELGDLVIGYQIHATLDQNTRPAHAARNGQIYYKNPRRGQLGYEDLPNPPEESPREGRKIAWCCRCFTSPVLRNPGTKPLPVRPQASPVSTAVAPAQSFGRQEVLPLPQVTRVAYVKKDERLIPDPVTYSDWWKETSDHARRLAVGASKYEWLKRLLGYDPFWEHFIDPETGELLTLADLKSESKRERNTRTKQVQKQIEARRNDKIIAQMFGHVFRTK